MQSSGHPCISTKEGTLSKNNGTLHTVATHLTTFFLSLRNRCDLIWVTHHWKTTRVYIYIYIYGRACFSGPTGKQLIRYSTIKRFPYIYIYTLTKALYTDCMKPFIRPGSRHSTCFLHVQSCIGILHCRFNNVQTTAHIFEVVNFF